MPMIIHRMMSRLFPPHKTSHVALTVTGVTLACLFITGCHQQLSPPINQNANTSLQQTGYTHHPDASASSNTSSKNINVFRMNLGTEPPTLDPAKMDDLTSFSVMAALMKGLTQFGADLSIQPAMATSWEVSPDGLRYVFHLRKDARWSDGKPVTAKAFVYAWQRALNPVLGSPYAFFLYEIKHARAYYDGKLSSFKQVGVHAPSNFTLVVELERPTPFFLALTASPVMLPLREDVVEKWGDLFTEPEHFVGNGAYQLGQWRHEEKIVLTPNPYFYGNPLSAGQKLVSQKTPAKIEMLMISDANTSVVMYENGELDFIETSTSIPSFDVRRLKHKPEARSMPLHRISYFGFNTKKPPFDNPKVRQAFAYALDREYFPRLLNSGQKPLKSWISPGLTGYNNSLGIGYQPQKAKALLAEAGYPDGKGFPPVSIAFQTHYDIQKEVEIAQYLWKKNLNVSVRLNNMEWKMLLSQLNEDPPDMFRLGWFIDYPDADSYMGVFLSDNGNNHTQWKSRRYDAWVQQAVTTLDTKKRQQLYDSAQHLLLNQDAVIIPLYLSEKTYLVKPYVKGLLLNTLNLPNYDHLVVDKTAQSK
jgi:oligopeptide transport system substrate-binding protein